MTDHQPSSSRTGSSRIDPNPTLQLDTDLRLLPQQLHLGKAELLTDAITLPFTDIESRLGHYALGTTEAEKAPLKTSMKNYLGRLNANPHIPLTFRLKVLHCFEQDLDLFDAEMTAAVLNAHKVGVALVQEAARHDASYFPSLVDMISHAIELSIKLLRIDLGRYRAPAIIVTRQFFELAKLGLEVSASFKANAAVKTKRLHKAICNHEFLRRVDFFGQDQVQQDKIWHELQYHIEAIFVSCYQHGEAFTHSKNKLSMLVNLNHPHEQAQVINTPLGTAPCDCLVLPLDAFILRLGKGIRSVREVLNHQHKQSTALHTEDALESTMIGGKAILMALKVEKRHHARSSEAGLKVHLNQNLGKSIIKAFSGDHIDEEIPIDDPTKAWNVVDCHANGACLERISSQPLSELLDMMIGLNWTWVGSMNKASQMSNMPTNMPKLAFIRWIREHKLSEQHANKASQKSGIRADIPRLAFIRWVREHKPGEQRIGISFFSKPLLSDQKTSNQKVSEQNKPFQLAKAIIIGGNKDLQEKRTWPILIRPGETSSSAIFPTSKIYTNMTFMILQNDQSQYFKIHNIVITGSNYIRCEMIHAKRK